MANYIVTPNMNLPNPVPSVDPGPDYANNLSASLTQIDQHNHSIGQGVLIQPNGMNISSDLPFNGNNATALNTIRFLSLSAPIANSAPNVGCLYVAGNELYYNDYSGGNQIQLTLNGTVNATSSGISSGTASAAFSAGTLVVKSSSTSFANIDMQSAILSNSGNLSNQLTLQAPTLSSSYDITLPSIPAQTNVMTLDASGNMGSTTYDSVGQNMSSVGANAIGVSMTATGANAVANSRTRATGGVVGVGGVAISGSSGNFNTASSSYVDVTNAVVTITTTGRPVFLSVQPSGIGFIEVFANGGGQQIQFQFSGTALIAPEWVVNNVGVGSSVTAMISFVFVDAPPAGTYTYKLQLKNVSAVSGTIQNAIVVAYEL